MSRLAFAVVLVGGFELIRRQVWQEHPDGGWSLGAVALRARRGPTDQPATPTSDLAVLNSLNERGLISDEELASLVKRRLP